MQVICHPFMPLWQAFEVPRGVTALVGGGGKTTLMFHLAKELSIAHKVIVATTTHVMRPNCMPVLEEPGAGDIRRALASHNAIFAGRVASEDKMTASGIDAEQLAGMADYVLIEADGAKGRPLKAPAFYEPVIPACTALVIAVAGLDGNGRAISETAHRPALLAAILGVEEDHIMTPADLAKLLTSADGQRRGVLPHQRFAILLNKADDDARLDYGKQIAAGIDPALAERVVIASFNGTEANLC